MSSPENRNGKAVAEMMLQHDPYRVLVTVGHDGRGVDLPHGYFVGQLATVAINLEGPNPPPDMVFDDWGIRATLQFGDLHHKCAIPWDQVVVLQSGDGAAATAVMLRGPGEEPIQLPEKPRRLQLV